MPKPALIGPHQIENAGTALACLDRLKGLEISPVALARGLEAVAWPARLQRLSRGRLAALLPPGSEFWLDGGHNAGGGVALAAMARASRGPPLHLVFGMLASHDAPAFLAPLAPFAASLAAVAIPGEAGAMPAEAAAAAAQDLGIAAEFAADIAAAVARAASQASPGRVLICGSLYLAGRVLAENLALGQGADLGRRHLAVLEQDQRRDAADAIFHRRLRILVDVDLGDRDLALHVAGQLLEERRDHLAGTAPLRPEVDEHRPGGAQHIGLERGIGDLGGDAL